MNIRTLTIEERERLAYIEGRPDAKLLGEILAAQMIVEEVEADLADALDRLGAQ